MSIDTNKLRELVAAVNFSSEAHGESRWYGEGDGTIIRIDRDGVGMADFDLVAHLSPATVEKIADHIDAQAAEIEALRQHWQPIETAPKDGTHVILTNGTAVSEGWWEHQEPYIRPERNAYGGIQDQAESDGYDDWLDALGGMQPSPTHWMPLPAPPAALAQHQGERHVDQ